MTGDQTSVNCGERRYFINTSLLTVTAAFVEITAGWRIRRVGDLALQPDAFDLDLRVGNRHR